MTESKRAIFLSYASQDAEAARHIVETLRSAGIEVWFDQSELRGGDAWDRRISKQIHECVLFIALISAHSDARAEGYFRREWRIAVDRTRDMADDEALQREIPKKKTSLNRSELTDMHF
jgi:TIR domain